MPCSPLSVPPSSSASSRISPKALQARAVSSVVGAVVDDGRVHVAVAGVAEGADRDAGALGDRPRPPRSAGRPPAAAPRRRRAASRPALERRVGEPPGRHQHPSLGLLVGGDDEGRPGLLADPRDRRDLLGALDRPGVGAGEEQRRVLGSRPCGAIASTAAIVVASISSSSEGSAAAMIRSTATPAAPMSAKEAARVIAGRGGRSSRSVTSVMIPERALRAAEEPGEVVAGDALAGAVTEAHRAAVGEHHLELQQGVARHPVFDAAEAAGVGRDVAADRREFPARRVRRVPEPGLAGGRGDVGVDRPRLDRDRAGRGVELATPRSSARGRGRCSRRPRWRRR